jgi:hypothetical protein
MRLAVAIELDSKKAGLGQNPIIPHTLVSTFLPHVLI